MRSPLDRCFSSRAIACVVVTAVLCLTGWAAAARAQRPQQSGDLEVLEVRPNVHVIIGAGGNIVVHTGWMGAVVVDTGSAGTSDKILAAIKGFTSDRIRLIINTTADPDHVGGNEALSKAGINLLRVNTGAFGGGGGAIQLNSPAAGIMAHENVLKRMSAPSGRQAAFPVEAWPTEAFTGARNRSLYLNGDGVQMMHQAAAHTDADSFIHFRRADVIAAGDILDLRHFPIIDVEKGGTINGEIDALTHLIEISVPPAPLTWHEDRTLIIPGHGRICDQGDVVEYRDMLVIIRDRVQDLIKKGNGLDQIKKANPTNGYNKQYGSNSQWNSDMFVTAVYRSLTGAKPTS